MPRPDDALVLQWRKLADEGYLYAEIARLHPQFSRGQVRHYCLGSTGRRLPGPIQSVDRWYGSNVWMRGENSPHALLTATRAKRVLDDWDEKADRWKSSGAEWARRLGVSRGAIYSLRRGESWRHLDHPNQGRRPKKSRRRRR